MDSGVVQSRVHESDQHYGADEQPHNHEKNSVLKKVKAKAKKIKDTIKKHAHHDHEHIPDDHDLDEEDDEDEDMIQNPEVHGAPMYESTVARTVMPVEQVHHQEPKVVVVTPDMGTDQTVENDSATRTFAGEDGNAGQQKVNLQKPIGLEEDPAAPGIRQPHTASNYQSKVTDPIGAGAAEIQVSPVLKSFAEMNVHDGTKSYPESHVRSTATQYTLGAPTMHREQQHNELVDRPSNQSSYTATQYPPAAAMVHQEQKHNESEDRPSSQSNYTTTQYPPAAATVHQEQKHNESEDRPSSQSNYTTTQYPPGAPLVHEEQKHNELVDRPSNQSSYTTTQYPYDAPVVHEEQKHCEFVEKPLHPSGYSTTQYPSGTSEMNLVEKCYEPLDKPSNQSSYTDKISSATSAISDKAVNAKNAVASKIGYDNNQVNRDNENEPSFGENQSSYTDKISYAPSAVADKAVAAKNMVSSKLGYDDNKKEIRQGEDQSSYKEKLSSAPSAIADKAASAKNAVTSNLCYGDNEKETNEGENQGSYTRKISSASSAIADKAVSAKNAVTSNLGYGDTEKETRQGENQSSYTDKISYATSTIADKAVAAKNAVTSKLGYGDNKVDRDNEKETRHGEENQSSYTEKISSATSAIVDKAVSAKNAVTSRLSYGSGVSDNKRTTHEDHRTTEEEANASGMSGASTAEYGKKITESLTEKLSPVYGKVAGVGNTVKSKLSPSTNESDKGVSVKDYFVEKLRPGDEDRALSEVITEALLKRGGEATVKESGDHEGRKMTDVVSDVIHEQDEGLAETEHRPLGKVTESEEVKRRLGGDSENDRRYEESYENSSGKGVVDKLKDAAGSWFGKSQENQSSQDTGERRLQESSN